MSIIEESISELASNGVSRRGFIQSAAAVGAGLALPAAGIVGATSASAATLKQLRVAGPVVQAAPAPFTTADGGSLQILNCVGEYMSFCNDKGELEPRVAESWKGAAGGSSWTFKIRKGIKFHDGSDLTADDVVWTFKSHLNPVNKSQSAGKFVGILNTDGITKVDKYTVRFKLLAPVGAFPGLLGSTSYGLIIIKDRESGGASWQDTMNGCGPWILDKYTKGDRTSFKKNPNYWDSTRQPSFNSMVLIQFASADAAAAQLRTGKLDAVSSIQPSTALTLPKAKINLVVVSAAQHLEAHMRCDFGPFTDKRVRQAAALTLDRAAYIKGVMKGFATMGNDSNMDPYPTADKSVPQREKDLVKAKALMVAAGVPNGFNVNLSTYTRDDISALAQWLKSSFALIGINVTLKINESYYSPPWDANTSKKVDNNIWLESNLGITDWGHRPSPAEILTRSFKSKGDWNAAHFNSAEFDAAADEFIRAISPAAQMKASKKVQELALDGTPYIIANFQPMIAATRKGLTGFYTNGMGQFESAAVKLA